MKTLDEQPADGERRSTRSIALETGLTPTAVTRLWRAFRLHPSKSSGLDAPVEFSVLRGAVDVFGCFLAATDRAVAFGVDPATPNRLSGLNDACQKLPKIEIENSAVREMISVFAGQISTAGHRLKRHLHQELVDFCQRIDAVTPSHLEIHLVIDNDALRVRSTRNRPTPFTRRKAFRKWVPDGGKVATANRWLTAHPRFHIRVLPDGAEWLKLVSWSLVSLRDPGASALGVLEKALIEHRNKAAAQSGPFVWTADAKQEVNAQREPDSVSEPPPRKL